MRALTSFLFLLILLPTLSGCMGSGHTPEKPTPAQWSSGSDGGPEAAGGSAPPADGPPRAVAPNGDADRGPAGGLAAGAAGSDAPIEVKYPRSVVVVGETPNVYHEVFRRPGWTEHPATYIPGFPGDAKPLNLSLDAPTFEEAVEADRAIWETVEGQELYYIPGTVFVGFYIQRPPQASPFEGPSSFAQHGTGVAAHVVGLEPDRAPPVGIFLSLTGNIAGRYGEIVAKNWTWADVTTTSAVPAAPMPPGIDGEYARWLYVKNGGISLLASANHETTLSCGTLATVTCTARGPPWSVSVGLVLDEGESPNTIKGGGPLDIAARAHECPTRASLNLTVECHGTSYATPRIAGYLAALLAEVREAWGWHDCRPAIACARGASVPESGPLADGSLERNELLDVVYRTARDGDRELLGMTNEADLSDAGWGITGDAEIARARQVLWGQMEAPLRPETEGDWAFWQEMRHRYWDPWIPAFERSQALCPVHFHPSCV